MIRDKEKEKFTAECRKFGYELKNGLLRKVR